MDCAIRSVMPRSRGPMHPSATCVVLTSIHVDSRIELVKFGWNPEKLEMGFAEL